MKVNDVNVCKREKLILKKGTHSQIERSLTVYLPSTGSRPHLLHLLPPQHRNTYTLVLSWHSVNANPKLNIQHKSFLPILRGRFRFTSVCFLFTFVKM